MPANLAQSQWVWSGWNGAPGYTSFYYDTVDPTTLNGNLAAEHTFLAAMAGYFPGGVTMSPPANFRLVDAASGNLFGFIAPSSPPAAVVGASSGSYAAPAGASVNWLTTTPATHRNVVGRSYFVPLSSGAYQADGTLVDAAKTAMQAAAAAFVAATDPIFVIWRRPVSGAGGSVAPVVGARVNDRVSILRSRRS